MKIVWILIAVFLTGLPQAQVFAAKQDLVLVAAYNTVVPQMSPDVVRRLYIGVPVEAAGHVIVPLINASDSLVLEIFMQQVLFMSYDVYIRQNSSRSSRKDDMPAQSYSSMPALIAALRANPYAVTYMLRSTAIAFPDLKIIAELWRSEE
ncbi:MAG: hypothetical protein ACYC3O_06735 [Burkholderiales bacterium]